MVWVRISVLAVLLAVVGVVVTLGRDGGRGEPVATKYGVTSQGRAFELELDDDAQPVAFDTELAAMCQSGRMVTYELALDATVAKGGALRGTMELVVHVRPQTRAAYDCVSPKVRFSAGR